MGTTASLTQSFGLATQSAGAVASTVGAYSSSQMSAEAYAAQAAVATNNAKLAQQSAQDAISRGIIAEANQRQQTAQVKSTQRARMAANGIDINVGSAAAVQESTDFLGNLDALTIRENASREAAGYIRERNNDIMNAGLLKGRAGAENPLLSATSTLLTGAGQVASNYYKYKQVA